MFNKKILFSFSLIGIVIVSSCGKEDVDNKNNGQVDCASKNLTLTADIGENVPCSSVGQLTIHASGSTGWTFQLGTGAFQADSVFKGLATGNYTITAKDKDGCTKTQSFTVTENTTKGSKFQGIVSMVTLKCNLPCHASGQGGATVGIMSTDCKIIAIKNNMIQKAINENMGSLNNTEKAQLQAWVDAGGRYTD